MNDIREPIRFLTEEEMATLHKSALRILAEVGMKIDHDEALDYLQAAGCKINREKMQVKIPEEVSQKCVDKMKQDYRLRKNPEMMSVRYSHIRFKQEPFRIHHDFSVNSGGYCVFIYDLKGVRRYATLQDTREALILADRLDQITYTGLPVAAQDIPLPIRQIRMAAELVKHTSKLGGIEALSPFDIEYIQRIGEIVRGSRKELKKRPILIGYAEAKSPLTLDHNMCEIFIEYIKRGMPQSLDTMPDAGLTAPIHPAGLMAVGLAETIAGLVLAYAIDPDAVVTLDITPSFADPSTGIFRYAGSERASLICARIQLLGEYYGCPSGVHGGKTDSLFPDIRCGVEKGISMIMPILAGAIGIGTVGHIENALTYSPIQLVMDNEIARYVRSVLKGFEVSEDTVNLDLIKQVGIGGSYMQEMNTAQYFREFINLSPFFTVESWGNRQIVDETKRWENMAKAKVKKILAEEHKSPLKNEQIKEIDAVIKEAEARLTEKGVL